MSRFRTPVGLDHQDDDQDVEGDDLVEISPFEELAVEIWATFSSTPMMRPPTTAPSTLSSPTEDDGRKHLDAEEGGADDTPLTMPTTTPATAETAAEIPQDEREHLAHRDAERLGHLLVEGGRPHGKPMREYLKNQAEPAMMASETPWT